MGRQFKKSFHAFAFYWRRNILKERNIEEETFALYGTLGMDLEKKILGEIKMVMDDIKRFFVIVSFAAYLIYSIVSTDGFLVFLSEPNVYNMKNGFSNQPSLLFPIPHPALY